MRKYILMATALALIMTASATAVVAHDPIEHLWEAIGEIRTTLGSLDERVTALETGAAVPTPEPTPEGTYRGMVIAAEDRCAEYDRDDYSYPQSVEADIVAGMGGIIYSPYTGEYFDSTDDTDIEHIVATSEAHDSGMCAATDDEKDAFARDLLNLTLAAPTLNRHEKGAKDAAEWLPDENQCWFADTIVKVRVKYELTVDQTEADALEDVLEDCDSVEMIILPESGATPEPTATPGATHEPTATPVVDALALYDDNGDGRITCAEARRHGIAPVHRGHPAYEFMDDRDGDGVVCESGSSNPTPTPSPEPTATPVATATEAIRHSSGTYSACDISSASGFSYPASFQSSWVNEEPCVFDNGDTFKWLTYEPSAGNTVTWSVTSSHQVTLSVSRDRDEIDGTWTFEPVGNRVTGTNPSITFTQEIGSPEWQYTIWVRRTSGTGAFTLSGAISSESESTQSSTSGWADTELSEHLQAASE